MEGTMNIFIEDEMDFLVVKIVINALLSNLKSQNGLLNELMNNKRNYLYD